MLARPPIWHVSCRHADMLTTCHKTCRQHEQCRDLPKRTWEDICPYVLALHSLHKCCVAKYADTWLRLTPSHGVGDMLAVVQNKVTGSDRKTCRPTRRQHFQLRWRVSSSYLLFCVDKFHNMILTKHARWDCASCLTNIKANHKQIDMKFIHFKEVFFIDTQCQSRAKYFVIIMNYFAMNYQ